jgi:hypothetical protein
MAHSIIVHLHFGGANISFRKRFRLFFVVAIVVLLLSGVKTAVHYLGLELLELNRLLTSGIGGAIFIIGFLLSSILADYKEAERIPADIRNSIEAIDGDLAEFAAETDKFDQNELRLILVSIIEKLKVGLGHDRQHKDIPPVLEEIAKLTPILGRLERLGMAANFVVRLRSMQDLLRRSVLRIYQIQRVEFVPSVRVLVQTLVFAIVVLMLLLKTEGDPASAILFGFISYMFVYSLYLVRLLEQPFAKGHASVGDVSLFLLDELELQLRQRIQKLGKEA